MTTLFVTMQDPTSRRWAPVARLSRENGRWCFGYTEGVRMLPGFQPFGRLSDLDAVYVSEELFPLFANRVLPRSRPEYHSYLGWLGLTEADPLEEMSRTGGLRATDGLELFGCPEPTADRRYTVQFFARGLRHLPEQHLAAIAGLAPGDRLFLMRDLQNPRDGLALMLRTDDPVALVGYVPRYYADDFNRLLDVSDPAAVTVQVEALNRDAPLQYLLRCRLSAPWPVGFVACAGPSFKALASRSGAGAALLLPPTA